MSYSRSYTFHVSGSVSYPASEHGGSVHYSDSVHVVVEVDTHPFDISVANCNEHVNAMCSTVAGEAARLVEAKKESARSISDSLVNGFFRYIKYGIQEKMMRLSSRLPILQKTLQAQAESCRKKRVQMEKDYRNITSRYAVIFTDLDESLEKSLAALDRPAFEVAALTEKTVANSCLDKTTALVPVSSAEESNAVAAVELARLKSATGKVVADGARYMRYNIELASRIEHMLRKSKTPGMHLYCMPVVKATATDLESNGGDRDEFFFPGSFPPARAYDLLDDLRSRKADGGGECFRQVASDEDGFASVDLFLKKRLSAAVSKIGDAEYGERFSNEVLRMWDALGRDRAAPRKVLGSRAVVKTGSRRI